MSEPIVVTTNLTKKFGDFTAVDEVNFEIFPKEVVGYLGPNGSGKTTTIRMLLGLLLPTSGSAQVLGFDSAEETEQVRANVGYMSQKFALYDELSVIENLTFYAGVYGVKDEKHLANTISRLGIVPIQNEIVDDLPVGWRQRLALATAIVHQPQVLFLDEPTSGVDPVARRVFWDLIYDLVEEGIAALVTTHYMDEAEYCQRVGIMRAGKLLAIDTPAKLKNAHFTGKAWNVYLDDLLEGLATFEGKQEVIRSGLAGNHLRVITSSEARSKDLGNILKGEDLNFSHVDQVDPSLEDIFLSLAK